MNILFIGNPSSIHDLKWMSFFSMKDGFKVFLVTEKQNLNGADEKVFQNLKENKIELLPAIQTFSIKNLLGIFQSVQTLNRYVQENKIDIVHILFATPNSLWGKFLNAPYIITTRGSDILLVLPKLLEAKGLRGIYFRWLFSQFKKSFQKAEAIVCTSQMQADKVKELFCNVKNLLIIRTGIDVAKIEAINSSDALLPELKNSPFVFFPRFIKPVYNTLLCVDAMEHLSNEIISEFKFVFIKGKNFDEKYFQTIIQKLEALKKSKGLQYVIIEYLGQEELWQHYKAAKLTVMTPLSDGTPNTALEAMAARCPLIIPDLPYDKTLFENTCFVLKKNEPEKLAALIAQAIQSYPVVFLENALKAVNEFGNRPSEMKKVAALYREVAGK